MATKLKNIELDLDKFKVRLYFQNDIQSLIIHFDTPSRRFYFAVITLIVSEMKKLGRPEFIHLRSHEKILKLLDNSLSGKYASKETESMWTKIRKTWRYNLADLEMATHFTIEDRSKIAPYEKGGRYRYECSDDECDIWANLFQYDESNKWRFKFAIDSASLELDDIHLTLGNLKDSDAWKAFIDHLRKTQEPGPRRIEHRQTTILVSLYRPFIIAIMILIVSGLVTWYFIHRSISEKTKSEIFVKTSIAILPFVNLSNDQAVEYFSDGITEELINSLARVKDLHVISRTSSFYFKDKSFDLRAIGEKLNVENILEGSIRVSGDKLRISAQLVKAADDSHIWGETYDLEMEDIFNTQESLAQVIACSLKSRLGCNGDEIFSKRYTENVEAYNQYLKGRFLWNKKSHKEAIAHYEQALKLDPNYALAFAGLADAYNRLAFWFSGSVKEHISKARSAALKALELDDSLSEAHTSLGMLKLHFEWDWNGAESAFKRAISLNPDNAIAHCYYSHFLRVFGRMEEAVAEMGKALLLDPLSRKINAHYGMMLNVSGQTDKSIRHYRKVLELFPDSIEALLHLGRIIAESGQYEEGIKLLERAVNLTQKKSPFPIGFLGYVYAIAGKQKKARDLLNEMLERRPKEHFPSNFIALIYVGLGDKENALSWLERAVDEHDPASFTLRNIPMFKSLHSDPRWVELMKKMGLEE